MLEPYLKKETDSFIRKGLQLMIDGTPPEKIRQVIAIDMHFYEIQQRNAAKIWNAAGGYAPTVGILGAVLGLIHVMENLSDPSKLGSGIAVAFVATIYGVGLANLVFLPISNKLKALIQHEMMRREMLLNAWVSIASGDHPRVVEERLLAYLR
jgi:chemotaxis protein MotA